MHLIKAALLLSSALSCVASPLLKRQDASEFAHCSFASDPSHALLLQARIPTRVPSDLLPVSVRYVHLLPSTH